MINFLLLKLELFCFSSENFENNLIEMYIPIIPAMICQVKNNKIKKRRAITFLSVVSVINEILAALKFSYNKGRTVFVPK